RPEKSVKPSDLIDTYAAKPGVSSEEVARVTRFWTEFTKAVGIKTLRELTHEHVEAYEAKIAGRGLASKSIKHRYSGIRTVIAYRSKSRKVQEDYRRSLHTQSILDEPEGHSIDPTPITPTDYWAIQ